MKSNNIRRGSSAERPGVPYWEDPVYHFLSRRHRLAVAAGLMQELVSGSMPDELYRQLGEEGKADRRNRQQERKKFQKPPTTPPSGVEGSVSVNTADLKKRIFNPHVSRENAIKALEALPPGERKTTIASLPPGLRRKLGNYLKSGRH